MNFTLPLGLVHGRTWQMSQAYCPLTYLSSTGGVCGHDEYRCSVGKFCLAYVVILYFNRKISSENNYFQHLLGFSGSP